MPIKTILVCTVFSSSVILSTYNVKKMPRKAFVTVDEAVAVLKKYIIHFKNELPPYSSSIWKTLSNELDRKWSFDVVYTNVRQNRRNILTMAREELGLYSNDKHKQINTLSCVVSNNSSSSSSNSLHDTGNSDDENTQIFTIIFTQDEWNKIRPNDYEKFLKPTIWTNIIAIKFAKVTKIPCAFIFKRSKISTGTSARYYLQIFGKCKLRSCGNSFFGYMENEPSNNNEIKIQVKTRDTRLKKHDIVKRPLNGERRKTVKKELMTENPSRWRKRIARENMNIGDGEPNFLPNLPVLRQAKKEHIYEELGIGLHDGHDIIRTIENLSTKPEFIGMIKDIGSMPFYVFYNTPAQLYAYKQYCKIKDSISSIGVDATGSLIRKLKRPNNRKSKHIFLYQIVVNFEHTTLPVIQMITERNDTEFIYMWLNHWLRQGAKPPIEAVSDYSRALLSALCLAFNYTSLKWYINDCFLELKSGLKNKPVRTFIRVDVAHLMHLVAKWKVFKHLNHVAIKEFYLRCISLLIDSTSFESFEKILSLILILSQNQYIDSIIESAFVKNIQEAKESLESLISNKIVISEFLEDTLYDYARSEDETEKDVYILNCDEKNNFNDIQQFAEELMLKAKNVSCEGKNLNVFYLPNFAISLLRLVKEFPLWTSVCIPYKNTHASSSYVEAYFNQLKTIILKKKIYRADAFLIEHLRDITGEALLFVAKLKRRNEGTEEFISVCTNKSNKDARIPIENVCNEVLTSSYVEVSTINDSQENTLNANDNFFDDSDLKSFENWRNKGEEKQLIIYSSDSENDINNNNQLFISNDSLLEHSYCNESKDHDTLIEKKSIKNNTFSKVEKKNPSKYFQSVPEIKQVNNFILTNKRKKVFLLPNGSLCNKPVILKGNAYFIRSTCAFDSIIHILMCGAIENVQYATHINLSSNATLQFVYRLLNTCCTKDIINSRVILLKEIYKPKIELKTKVRNLDYTIDAWDNVCNLISKLLNNQEPTYYTIRNCHVCGKSEQAFPLLTVNHKIIGKEGFSSLEKSLQYRSHTYNIKCKCGGKVTLEKKLYIHLFIELDIRTDLKTERGLKCKLKQLPTLMAFKVNDENNVYNYRLIGVISYFPGHFSSFCLRANGKWEHYDDLKTEINVCSNQTEIEPHVAVYIKN